VVPARLYGFENSWLDLRVVFREIGVDRFAQLWRSDKPYDEAFVDIVGVTRSEFLHRMLLRQTGSYRPGPWPSPVTFLSFIVLCLLSIGAASTLSRRPRVA
jgi:hypothetical protein